ncbi:MAG: 16S rRNA (adenine(1518)-N(6)/adenine(1519)-N(6))-dimethyltransferase [Draconibacterium sp.]|nr:MAG: 16S rRNA (adenine(1518)-N(6)/adenine(1519)-N(6))-dimethyltransferase [Draconibacterium sp.]
MSFVQPKKKLGQHFLTDHNIARKIVDSLDTGTPNVLEIGPGTGVLTQFLLQRSDINLKAIEIDLEAIAYLGARYPQLNIVSGDFLKIGFEDLFPDKFRIIGNFPYYISSQIFFKVLEFNYQVPEVICMVQKEVAERIAAPYNSKTYGILSVLLQTYYDIKYLFTVPESVFYPPPKVKSAVIQLVRNNRQELPCNEKFYIKVVKTAFQQRRKMLRNSLATLSNSLPEKWATKRPEQLAITDFIDIAVLIENLEN